MTKDDQELWRVRSIRPLGETEIRHTRWFINEAGAREYAKWVEDDRGKVLSIAKYVLESLS